MSCPTPCDDGCDADCHESHQVRWKREHRPEDCPPRGCVVRDPSVYEQDPDAEAYLFAEPEIDRPRRRGYR